MTPRIFHVTQIGQGSLAIMPGPRADDLMNQEFAQTAAVGFRQIVSLLEPTEASELGLMNENEYCQDHGMRFVQFPIADRGIPNDVRAYEAFIRRLSGEIQQGDNTVVHCRANRSIIRLQVDLL